MVPSAPTDHPMPPTALTAVLARSVVGQIELEQERAKAMAYEDELAALEKERLQLLKKLRVKALERGERAAKEGVSVEKLAAMEELAADLDDDPDFAGESVGRARLNRGGQAGASQQHAASVLTQQAISASFASVNSLEELRRRGTAVQAELAQKGAALQEAEAAKRKAEREKASLQQDLERAESRMKEIEQLVAAGAADSDGGFGGGGGGVLSAQLAALSMQNDSMRAALADARRAMKETIAAVANEPPPRVPPPPPTTTTTTTTTTAAADGAGATRAVASAAMASLTAAAEQLDDRMASLKDLVREARETTSRPAAGSTSDTAAFPTALPASQQPAVASDAAAARLFGAGPPAMPPPPPQVAVGGAGLAAAGLDSKEAQRARLHQVLDRQQREAAARPPPGGEPTATRPSAAAVGSGARGTVAASIERADVGGEGAVVLPAAFAEEGVDGDDADGRVDPYDLVAALNAQLIECKAMLAGQGSQLIKAEREVRKYKGEMGGMHEQQTYLYASHVREVRTLQKELTSAAKRALAAEKQHQEDVVRIESWATMADALETTGGVTSEEGQRKVAMMGRRLTALRVREMELARQATIQDAELRDLRMERGTLQKELANQQVETAAELARLERSCRELSTRCDSLAEELEGTAPRADLESERREKERLLAAYKSLAEQAARTAGCASDAARYESEATSIQQRLSLTETALAAANLAAEERAKALEQLSAKIEKESDGRGGHGNTAPSAAELYRLESRIQSLTIAEAGAMSRAEAAERLLDDAMRGRQELADRLQVVEQPVAELTEQALTLQTELDNARAQLAALGAAQSHDTSTAGGEGGAGGDASNASFSRRLAASGGGKEAIKADLGKVNKELHAAKEEAIRAKEYERIATFQLSDLSGRQTVYEQECATLREQLVQMQASGDDQMEMGKLQWAVLQARRAEGEARRREAAANARRNHVQSSLFRLQLETETHDVSLHDAQTSLRAAEAECARARSSLAQRDGESTRMAVVIGLRDKVKEAAQQAEESHRVATTLRKEREELYTELAAAAARDDEQRNLLHTIATAAQKQEHAKLLAAPVPSAALQRATAPQQPTSGAMAPSAAEAAAVPADGAAAGDGGSATSGVSTSLPPPAVASRPAASPPLSDHEIVSLVTLSAAKTDLKVSELRLRRRVAALELAELSAKQQAHEASTRREELEEELVRTKDATSLTGQQGEAREADMQAQISQLRHQMQALKAEHAHAAAAAAAAGLKDGGPHSARRLQPPVPLEVSTDAADVTPVAPRSRVGSKPGSKTPSHPPSASRRSAGGTKPSPAASLSSTAERDAARPLPSRASASAPSSPKAVATAGGGLASTMPAVYGGGGVGGGEYEGGLSEIEARAELSELSAQVRDLTLSLLRIALPSPFLSPQHPQHSLTCVHVGPPSRSSLCASAPRPTSRPRRVTSVPSSPPCVLNSPPPKTLSRVRHRTMSSSSPSACPRAAACASPVGRTARARRRLSPPRAGGAAAWRRSTRRRCAWRSSSLLNAPRPSSATRRSCACIGLERTGARHVCYCMHDARRSDDAQFANECTTLTVLRIPSRRSGLAEESIRAVQAQLRRKETELSHTQQLLSEAREANRLEKASMAADSERLAQRLDEQNEELVQRGTCRPQPVPLAHAAIQTTPPCSDPRAMDTLRRSSLPHVAML